MQSSQEKALAGNKLELLVIQSGESKLAIRAAAINRLRRFKLAEIQPLDNQTIPGGLGHIPSQNLPVLHLAGLLGLDNSQPLDEATCQIIVTEFQGQDVGFVVEQAHEMERAELQDIHLLPAVIEQLLYKPAVWALWQPSPENIVPLVDLSLTLNSSEWQQLFDTLATAPK